MKIVGTIKVIQPVEEFKEFKKRSIIVETEEQYPQLINVELHQQKVELADKFQVGSKVTVHINLRGREWTSPAGEVKYFNTLQGWKISAEKGTPPPPPAELPQMNFRDNDDDGLPF